MTKKEKQKQRLDIAVQILAAIVSKTTASSSHEMGEKEYIEELESCIRGAINYTDILLRDLNK